MDATQTTPARPTGARFELRFARLFGGCDYAFPCDAQGNVSIDGLNERARINYYYARTTVGRDFCSPVTCAVLEAAQP